MPKLKHLTLDGRTLEGGGQLLRIAICLSALTSIPLKIHSIRGNRAGGGGLKPQHLASVLWLAEACNAHTEGAEKGSTELIFEPGQGTGKTQGSGVPPVFKKKSLPDGGGKVWEARLDIGTAGSTGLALQAILPFILFTPFPGEENLPIHLTLSGGTNVSGSPSYEYITQVLLPTLKAIGFPEISATLHKRGWSQGGNSVGSVTLEIPSRRGEVGLPAFTLAPADSPGETQAPPARPKRITATFLAPTACHAHFKQIFVSRARQLFSTTSNPATGDDDDDDEGQIPITIRCTDSAHPKRLYLIAVLTTPSRNTSHEPPTALEPPTLTSPADYILASDYLYDKKLTLNSNKTSPHEVAAEQMSSRVLEQLHAEWQSGAHVDEHLRDQLVIFQALTAGQSRVYPSRNLSMQEGEGEAVEYGLQDPSLHTQTAEWVVHEMLGAEFDGRGGCEGVGFAGNQGVDWLRQAKEKKKRRGQEIEALRRRVEGVDMT